MQLCFCSRLKLDNLRYRLKRWREVTAREFPDRPDLLAVIPTEEDITIAKLATGGAITTDTCNSIRKAFMFHTGPIIYPP